MTVEVRFYKQRLTTSLQLPGGKTLADAIGDAEAGLRNLAGVCEACVSDSLAAIDAAFGRLPDRFDHDALMALYRPSSEIVGSSAVTGMVALDKAAHGLCDLVHWMTTHGACDRWVIQAHTDALHAFRSHGASLTPSQTRDLLGRLSQVREQYMATSNAGADPAEGNAPG